MNDDMDEIFRKAAENYPLKANNPDWDSVIQKMKEDVVSPDTPVVKKRSYRPLLLLLLLLIAIGILEYRYSFIHNQFEKKKLYNAINNSKAVQQEKSTITLPTNPVKPVEKSKMVSIDQSAASAQIKQDIVVQKQKQAALISADKPSRGKSTTSRHSYSSAPQSVVKINNASATQDEAENFNNVVSNQKRPDTKITLSKEGADPQIEILKDSSKKIVPEDSSGVHANKAEIELSKIKDKPLQEEPPKSQNKLKRFYTGIMGGPDFSAIKLQPVKKTGINLGFIIGYRLNNSWSIETGLLKNKKFYSTDGKYFHAKYSLPSGYIIEHATGVCHMIELPVNIAFKFLQRPKSELFVSTGFSSYFMRKESYVYDVNHNGNRYPRAAEYDDKSSGLLTVINVSGGYNYKLGKFGELRLEPFIKLPVQKIGSGNLLIQSGGVYLGFLKNIF